MSHLVPLPHKEATMSDTVASSATEAAVLQAENTVRVARACIDALNEGDEARLQATLAPDAIWHSAATGETMTGSEDVARNLYGYRGSFPDLREEITNAFASPEQAAIETLVTGTYDG